jgi:hypothetical protein
MRSRLVILLIVILNTGFAQQPELTVQKLRNYYSRFQPEYIEGHLNKVSLTQGERLLFKLWINSTSKSPHNLSVIVYAEIVDDTNTILSRQKLRVSNGEADGMFEIPETLPTGEYSFRAYTLWMRNVGEWSFFQQPVSVRQLSDTMAVTPSSVPMTNTKILGIRQSGDGQVEIVLDTVMDGFLIAHQTGKPLYSSAVLASNKKSHVFPLGNLSNSVEVGLFDMSGKLVAEASHGPDTHSEALSISTSKKTFKAREKIQLMLTLADDIELQNDFVISIVRKQSGRQNPRSNFSGSVPWSSLLNSSNVSMFPREIYIFPVAEQSLQVIGFGISGLKGVEPGMTAEKIKKIYELPSEIRALPLLKLPTDNTYLPGNYSELPTLEDFFQEVVPEARVKKTGGTKAIFLRNIENPNRIFFYAKSPLLLIDNKIIASAESFLSTSPATIQSIDFTWRTETINATGIQTLANTGVISVFTKGGSNASQGVYSDFSKPVEFSLPKHDGAITLDKLPDFRSTLFWNASFKINSSARLAFNLSDDLGDFTIDVVGQTPDGKIIRQTQDFSVSAGQ